MISLQKIKLKLLVGKKQKKQSHWSLVLPPKHFSPQGMPTIRGALYFLWQIIQRVPHGLKTQTIIWGSTNSQFQCFTNNSLLLLLTLEASPSTSPTFPFDPFRVENCPALHTRINAKRLSSSYKIGRNKNGLSNLFRPSPKLQEMNPTFKVIKTRRHSC